MIRSSYKGRKLRKGFGHTKKHPNALRKIVSEIETATLNESGILLCQNMDYVRKILKVCLRGRRINAPYASLNFTMRANQLDLT